MCRYHVAYAFQSEPTLYSCLNVKELLAQNKHEIWSLSDRNWTRTHNHLVRKWTLNHLAKLVLFEVFLVRIFPPLDWIGRDPKYLFVFNPNAGKYAPEKLKIRTLFTQCNKNQLLTNSAKKSKSSHITEDWLKSLKFQDSVSF